MKIVEGLPPRQRGGVAAIDVELFDLRPRQLHRPYGRLACMSICIDGELVYVIRKESEVAAALKRVDACEWIFHNAIFDLGHLRRWGDIPSGRPIWDTLLVERILYGGWYDDFDLAALARRWLDIFLDKKVREQFHKKPRDKRALATWLGFVLSNEMIKYAATDAYVTRRIYQKQRPALEANPKALWCYRNIDEPVLWPLLETKGILIDQKKLLKIASGNRSKAGKIAAALGFNPGSPKQCIDALRGVGVRVDSSGAEILSGIDHDLAKQILEYRHYADAASDMGEGFIRDYVEADGCVYPSLNPTAALTGRMSSSGPNGQQIPHDKNTRSCFLAQGRFGIADYNAQEPRILAALSKDQALIDILLSGQSPHLAVARILLRNPKLSKKRNKEEYRRGKAVNLGIPYGLSEYGLSVNEHIPLEDATALINNYFKTFWRIRRWIGQQRELVKQTLHIRTLGGRLSWVNPYARRAQNNAINSPIQGSGADVIKLATVLFYRRWKLSFKPEGFPLCLVVHDEILIDAPPKIIKRAVKLLEECMLQAFSELVPDVPGKVDVNIGRDWSEKT